MKEKSFLKLFQQSKKFDLFDEEELEKLQETKKVLIETNKNKKKTLIFGNGGSAAIAVT